MCSIEIRHRRFALSSRRSIVRKRVLITSLLDLLDNCTTGNLPRRAASLCVGPRLAVHQEHHQGDIFRQYDMIFVASEDTVSLNIIANYSQL